MSRGKFNGYPEVMISSWSDTLMRSAGLVSATTTVAGQDLSSFEALDKIVKSLSISRRKIIPLRRFSNVDIFCTLAELIGCWKVSASQPGRFPASFCDNR
jgi:hypothetical protein